LGNPRQFYHRRATLLSNRAFNGQESQSMQQPPPTPDQPSHEPPATPDPAPAQPGQPSEAPPEEPGHNPNIDVPSPQTPGTQPPTTPISPVG